MKAFSYAVAQELTRARSKHPQPHHSPHESFAVLFEEVDEFWEEVRAQKPDLELISDSPNVE